MDRIIYFDICSVPVFLITICTTLYRRMTRGRANKLFLAAAVLSLICVTAEILEHLPFMIEMLQDERDSVFVKSMCYTYFVTRNLMTVGYLLFVIAMTKTWYHIKAHWKKALILVPYFCLLVLLITNESNGLLFTVNAEIGYQRGSCIWLLYLIAMGYMIAGVIYLLVHRRTLASGEWFSLMSMYIMNAVSVIIQYCLPQYLVECFMTSLTLLFIVLYVQRPERQIEPSTGLPAYRAFCKEMGKIQATGQNRQIMIITFRNAREMHEYLKDAFLTYLQSVDEQIRLYARREKIDCDVFLEHPGTFYIILEDENYNPVQAIPELRTRIRKKAAEIMEQGAQPDACIVTVNYPKEIVELDELMRFGHIFVRYTDYSRIFSRAESILSQRSYQIEAHLDEILNRAVSSGVFSLRYQPLYAVKEGIFSAAEAIIDLNDAVFGSIDPELLMNAAEERGLSVLLGNRVLDEVFSFAGSNAMEQLHYKRLHMSLSVTHCMQMNLTDTIWNLRDKYHVDPSMIAFEIRESFYENMSNVFNENIKKLSAQGYRIVLDGFGRGYYNLQHILDMPITAVKLDRSLVSGASTEGGRIILKGVIEMVKQLPREVIADGADDRETAEMLSEMGCDMIQGHHAAASVQGTD